LLRNRRPLRGRLARRLQRRRSLLVTRFHFVQIRLKVVAPRGHTAARSASRSARCPCRNGHRALRLALRAAVCPRGATTLRRIWTKWNRVLQPSCQSPSKRTTVSEQIWPSCASATLRSTRPRQKRRSRLDQKEASRTPTAVRITKTTTSIRARARRRALVRALVSAQVVPPSERLSAELTHKLGDGVGVPDGCDKVRGD
jgi:hypothetical protein